MNKEIKIYKTDGVCTTTDGTLNINEGLVYEFRQGNLSKGLSEAIRKQLFNEHRFDELYGEPVEKEEEAKTLIGKIGVDSGTIWIGDPCYIMDDRDKALGKTWREFCEKINKSLPKSFNHDNGGEGLGICANSGYGDGEYKVFAVGDPNHPKGIYIDFEDPGYDLG